LVYIDFWSAVKLSFLVQASLGIILVVASVMIYLVLQSTGIFTTLNGTFQDVLSDPTFNISDSFSLTQVGIFSGAVAAVNVVVGTALGAIASMLYNFSVRMTGGLLVGFTNN